MKKNKKAVIKRKPESAVALPSVSVSFEQYDWEVIYKALDDKMKDLYERRFYAGGGYPRDIIEREMAYLGGDLMPKVQKLFKNFKCSAYPRY